MKWEDAAFQLPENSVKLLILDPPYFEVKGDFDFIWPDFESYQKDVEKWAKACKYVLAKNGSLFIYGHAKIIAYIQVIFDKYFNLENNLVWWVKDRQTNRGSNSFRCFSPVTERILFYSNEVERTGLEEIKLDVNNFKPLRDYFQHIQESLMVTKSEILKRIGGSADHCFRWGSTQWDMPTDQTYNQLIQVFSIDKIKGFKPYEELRQSYEELRQSYEELRQSYEELRRPFNNTLNLKDVLKFSQESHITKNFDHPTVKPEKLTRALILTCSNKNDLIVIPFAGSGTECAMAAKEQRRFIGFDINADYCKMATSRVQPYLENFQTSIF